MGSEVKESKLQSPSRSEHPEKTAVPKDVNFGRVVGINVLSFVQLKKPLLLIAVKSGESSTKVTDELENAPVTTFVALGARTDTAAEALNIPSEIEVNTGNSKSNVILLVPLKMWYPQDLRLSIRVGEKVFIPEHL